MSNSTFGIIKPDAVRAGHTGSIIQRIVDNGFSIRGLKLIHMTRKQAEGFYAVHSERPFFAGLTEFMSILAKQTRARCAKSLAARSARTPSTAPTQMKTPRSKSHTSSVV
jgi:nucleoside diphosphate kinase